MNDPDRWHWSDGLDDDAIFAEIVAHINDEAPAPQRTVRPAAEEGARESSASDKPTNIDQPPAEPTSGVSAEPTSGVSAEPTSEVSAEPTSEVSAEPTSGVSAEPTTEAPEVTGEVLDPATEEATDEATDQRSDVRYGWPFKEPEGPIWPDSPDVVPTSQVWRAHEVDPEYEEHFEPPPTAPLPAGDLQFWAIIVGMGGGPLLLLYFVFFNRDASSFWMLSAIAMSVGGFALLVSRLPRSREDDDDGARL